MSVNMVRAVEYKYCERCGKVTEHYLAGDCTICGAVLVHVESANTGDGGRKPDDKEWKVISLRGSVSRIKDLRGGKVEIDLGGGVSIVGEMLPRNTDPVVRDVTPEEEV